MRRFAATLAACLLAAACGGLDATTTPAVPSSPGATAAPTAATTRTPPSAAGATPAATPTPSPTREIVRNPAAVTDGAYAPAIDPAAFTTTIDNPFMPLVPGTTFVYEGGNERIVVEVTGETRVVMGVTTVVVRDQAFANGSLIEDTDDWFAQDAAGNVWYFGEATVAVSNGVRGSTRGSWEAGVDGAQPGIVMLAAPAVGDVYRQEYLRGQAEDQARIVDLDASTTVPTGEYRGVLVTEDFTPLEPGHAEHKLYARGVGLVEERVANGPREVALTGITTAP